MSHNIEIQDGALIVSDAHYSHLRPALLTLIKNIHSKKVQTTQLILMGDIFDALFGEVERTHKLNSEIIGLLNDISNEIELIYLEGNHDFNLKNIFVKAKVIPFKEQPLLCKYKDKKVYLAHGDFDAGLFYKLYTSIIRSHLVLFILKTIDNFTNHYILKKLDKFLEKKEDCKKFVSFEEYVQNRGLESFECDYFIEGHYHQNSKYKFEDFSYTNLDAFACNQRYFIVEFSKDKKLTIKDRLSQGDVKNG